MEELKFFNYSLLAMGLGLGFAAFGFFKIDDDNLPRWEKLPRNLTLGTVAATLGLMWCVPHARPLVPDSFQSLLIPLAVAAAVIGYFFLDYLFARALGGLVILLVYHMLHQSFTHSMQLSPLFSFYCYVLGVAGIWLCGKPHSLRDWIRAMPREKGVRMFGIGYLASFSILCLALAILRLKD